jgi:hypothetical protein
MNLAGTIEIAAARRRLDKYVYGLNSHEKHEVDHASFAGQAGSEVRGVRNPPWL